MPSTASGRLLFKCLSKRICSKIESPFTPVHLPQHPLMLRLYCHSRNGDAKRLACLTHVHELQPARSTMSNKEDLERQLPFRAKCFEPIGCLTRRGAAIESQLHWATPETVFGGSRAHFLPSTRHWRGDRSRYSRSVDA